jgi:putative redox protein
MMEARVTWQGRLSFIGTADSGYQLPLGTEKSVGGDEDGFRPMELIATGLAGCTAMDVISILAKKRQDVTAFDVQVHAERADDHPKVFTHAIIDYIVVGHGVDEAAVVRAIELSVTRYCPAHAMLGKVFPIEMHYLIYEDEGEERRSLVVSGEYTLASQESA